MKKKLCIFLGMFLCVCSLFAQSNSRLGYFKLDWGTTVEDAKKAGYKLTPVSEKIYNNFQKNYLDTIDVYSVTSKDKEPTFLYFIYYQDKLFFAREILPSSYSKQSRIEKRYGKYEDNSIISLGKNMYGNLKTNKDNKFEYWSIAISCASEEYVTVESFDWNVCKNIYSVIRKNAAGLSGGLSEEMQTMAKKLVQEGNNGKKPTLAILKLTSDDGNTFLEGYVTDSLTEALHKTNAYVIFEYEKINSILEAQKFHSSGYVNEDTAARIGYLSGTNYVCYGTVKDFGDSIKLNLRLVDVESGEICSMISDTFEKDTYIKNNDGKTSVPAKSTKIAKTEPAKKTTKVKSLWRCTKSRNNFDGYTTYTFLLKGAEDRYLLVGYDKNDVQSKSLVKAGFIWTGRVYGNNGTYDIKTDDGSIVSKKFKSNATWSQDTGWEDGDKRYTFSYNGGETAQFLVDLFGDNQLLSVRKDKEVQKFQPAGFWDYLASQGISKEEIYAAISNEEF